MANDTRPKAEAVAEIVSVDWARRELTLKITNGKVEPISKGDSWYMIRVPRTAFDAFRIREALQWFADV